MTSSDVFKNTVFDHPEPFSMLICSLAAGMLLRMLVDIFSVAEKCFGKNKVLCFFTDFFSIVGVYLFLFVCAYNFNNGIIRWYCIAICLAGYSIFRRLASKPFVKSLGYVTGVCEKLLSYIIRFLKFPAKRLYGFSVAFYRRTFMLLHALIRKRAYNREKNKVSAFAASGFLIAPHLNEEKD